MKPPQPFTGKIWDAVIIGGGFYGCALALFLRQNGHSALICESGNELMQRASYVNQARIHNGYHYPRSFMTAWRSLVNFPRFVNDFQECVDSSFTKVYAIARHNSKVSAYQFKQFCRNIGAPITPAATPVRRLFNLDLIEDAFVVKEYAFNAIVLRDLLRDKLAKLDTSILLNSSVDHVTQIEEGRLRVGLANGDAIDAKVVFNCTYAQLNTILHRSALPLLPLKQEIAELALIEPPPELQELGVTVMDGAFFSTMPFPAARLHSLSHVRYTPHESWSDVEDGYRDPHAYIASQPMHSNAPYMIRDAQRYLPVMKNAHYVRSLYEVKVVLMKNEIDDGRPILCREHYGLQNLYLILGGKIDNIYDVLTHLQNFAAVVEGSAQESNYEQE